MNRSNGQRCVCSIYQANTHQLISSEKSREFSLLECILDLFLFFHLLMRCRIGWATCSKWCPLASHCLLCIELFFTAFHFMFNFGILGVICTQTDLIIFYNKLYRHRAIEETFIIRKPQIAFIN